MGPGLIAFFAAAGIGGWTYNKLQQRTGYGNSNNAIIGTAVVFIIVFIIIFTIAQILVSHNN